MSRAAAARRCSARGSAAGGRRGRRRQDAPLAAAEAGGVAGLVGVPLGLAVVAEVVPASRPLAAEHGAGGAARGDHGVRAVGAGAPTGVLEKKFNYFISNTYPPKKIP